jgi:DNA mismatch repair protein MutS
MAQIGCPVPATAMTLIPYTGLYTRILGNDNLWAGMSSFVVEMTEFRSILRAADPHTLVIGDEVCAGTETPSAVSIMAAGIQHLAEPRAHFYFATHLHELNDIDTIVGNPGIRMYHLAVHTNPDGVLVYDRTLREGCGAPIYGLEVCRGLDMDAAFLERAFAIRKAYYPSDGVARASRYNARVVVDICAVCGSKDSLETHHIVPQADADNKGMIAAGVHKNNTANLVPLCDDCHTAHHAGKLTILGWTQTSHGRVLQFET